MDFLQFRILGSIDIRETAEKVDGVMLRNALVRAVGLKGALAPTIGTWHLAVSPTQGQSNTMTITRHLIHRFKDAMAMLSRNAHAALKRLEEFVHQAPQFRIA